MTNIAHKNKMADVPKDKDEEPRVLTEDLVKEPEEKEPEKKPKKRRKY